MTDRPAASPSVARPGHPVSRRAVLRGAGAAVLAGGAAALLAACGDDDGDGASATTSGGGGTTAADTTAELFLLAAFDANGSALRAGGPVRVTYTVAGADGVPLRELPDDITVVVSTEGEGGARRPVAGPVTVVPRGEGIPIPYLPVTFTAEASGYHFATFTVGGQELDGAFFVPPSSAVPGVGDPLPPVATATAAEPGDVEPVCTRTPPCPFHTVALDDALAAGGPTVLVVSTPAFCQTGVCGPTLDLLVDRPGLDPARVVHTEVYNDAAELGIFDATTVPLVTEYGLTFEPVLFVADADGIVVARLDNIWDGSELDEALALAGL